MKIAANRRKQSILACKRAVRRVCENYGGDPSAILIAGFSRGAIATGYILVSFTHVLLGELVPKYVAMRRTELSALLTARPLRVFHLLFFIFFLFNCYL